MERANHAAMHMMHFVDASDYDALIEQRDRLVEALKGGRQKLATYQSIYFGDKELRRLLTEWDDLLAKQGGAAPTAHIQEYGK
jgi:hypothetical protein